MKFDGFYAENTTLCDGSLAIIVSSRKCLVPISSLLVTPYLLLRGASIKVIVQAFNSRGGSVLSDPNTLTNVLVQTVPTKMNSPLRVSTTTNTKIDVSWTALSAPLNGGSEITSYFLSWD